MDVIFKDAIGQEIHAASALSPLAGITATLPKPMTSGAKAEGRFGKQDFVYIVARNAHCSVAWSGEDRALALVDGRCGDLAKSLNAVRSIDDYGNRPRIVRRVAIDGPASVGIDGRHSKRRNIEAQVSVVALVSVCGPTRKRRPPARRVRLLR